MESIQFYTFQQSLGFGTPRRQYVGLAIYSKNDEISWFVSTRWSNWYLDWRKCVIYIIWHTKTVGNHRLDMWMAIWNHFSNFWGVEMCIMHIFRNLEKSPGGLFSIWTFIHKISPTSISMQNLRFALKSAILWINSVVFSTYCGMKKFFTRFPTFDC